MSEELKPCPFCGGEVNMKIATQTLNANICCKKCDVIMKKNYKGSKQLEELLMQLITEDWNRRVAPAYDTNKVVEKLISESLCARVDDEPFIMLDTAIEIVQKGITK